MLRSKLKNKAADIAACKKQCNCVVRLNKESKHNYFDIVMT